VNRPHITALVLAAGPSSRMGGAHKLLEELGDKPVLRWAVDAALASAARDVSVVVGHHAEHVRAVLPEGVRSVSNTDHSAGLSSSLRVGVRALADEVDGVLVMLGDMPFVSAALCDALIATFEAGRVCVPVTAGRRGHPVLWTRDFFDEIAELEGDRGARSVMERHVGAVTEISVDDDGILVDIDDPHDLEQARSRV
jgi:molybdenum cofactor cytidylyltransferase